MAPAKQSTRAAKQYGCFISYKHGTRTEQDAENRGDSQFAIAIHSALHRIARPWWKKRGMHVFRDETVLAAEGDLGGAITRALDNSSYLLLVASPEAARSNWVSKELHHWLKSDAHAERVIIVVAAGRLSWDDARSAFVRELTDCIPAVLAAALIREPQWLDIRTLDPRTHLTLENPEFRRCVVAIAARIHARTPEDIDGEDAVRRRQLVQALSAGMMAALLLAAIAWLERGKSVRMQARAEAGLAFSRAQVALEQRPRDAVSLVLSGIGKLEKHQIPPESDAILAARRVAHANRDVVRWKAPSGNIRALTPLGDALVIVSEDMVMRLRKSSGIAAALHIADDSDFPLGAVAADYDPGARELFVIGREQNGGARWHRIALDESRRQSRTVSEISDPVGIAHFRGGRSVVSTIDGHVHVLGALGNSIKRLEVTKAGAIRCRASLAVCVVAEIPPTQFGGGMNLGETVERNSRLFVLDIDSGEIQIIESPHVAIASLAMKDDVVWSIGTEGLAQRYEFRERSLRRDGEPLRASEQPATAVAFDGQRLAVGSRIGGIRVWRDQQESHLDLLGHLPAVKGLAFDAHDDCLLWSAADDGEVRAWDLCAPVAARDAEHGLTVQSADGSWTADDQAPKPLFWKDTKPVERSFSCKGAALRVEVLALSNDGDAFVRCEFENEPMRHYWVYPNGKKFRFPDHEYSAAWFMSDGSLLLSLGSLLSGSTTSEFFPKVRPAELLYVTPERTFGPIDINSYGLAVTATEDEESKKIIVGTKEGHLLLLDKADASIEAVPIARRAMPNATMPLGVKFVACCLRSNQLVVALGTQGFPGGLIEDAREAIVIVDYPSLSVRTVYRGEARLLVGLSVISDRSEIMLAYGKRDLFSGAADEAVLRIMDLNLTVVSPDIVMEGGVNAQFATDDTNGNVGVIGLDYGRVWLDVNFRNTLRRLETIDFTEEKIRRIAELLEKAESAADKGHWQEVETACTEVLKLDQRHVECWLRRANAKLSTARFAEALSDYDRAGSLDPYSVFVPLQRSKALYAIGRYADAERDATTALERAKFATRPPTLVAGISDGLADFNRAVRDVSIKIWRSLPAEPTILRAKARLALGDEAGARSDLVTAQTYGLDNADTRALSRALGERSIPVDEMNGASR